MTADSSTENATPATDGAPGDLPAYKSALLEDVEEAMRDVVDPELGVNVVDLGLVYGIDVVDDVAVIEIGRASCRESVDLGGRRIIKKNTFSSYFLTLFLS